MKILGISAFYHDSAAALISDGAIVAAAQEERFTRKKHDPGFPRHAVEFCLRQAGTRLGDLDRVVFYDKPFLKFERLLETYIALAPRGFRSFQMALPLWLKEKLFQKSLLRKKLPRRNLRKRLVAASKLARTNSPSFLPLCAIRARGPKGGEFLFARCAYFQGATETA